LVLADADFHYGETVSAMGPLSAGSQPDVLRRSRVPDDSARSAMPDLEDLAIAAAYGLAVFLAGGLFFRHMKRGFADVL